MECRVEEEEYADETLVSGFTVSRYCYLGWVFPMAGDFRLGRVCRFHSDSCSTSSHMKTGGRDVRAFQFLPLYPEYIKTSPGPP